MDPHCKTKIFLLNYDCYGAAIAALFERSKEALLVTDKVCPFLMNQLMMIREGDGGEGL